MNRVFVSEQPLRLPPGVAEMFSSPEHYHRSPMEVVDYSKAPPPTDPFGWESLLFSQPEAPHPSLWRRLKNVLKGAR